MLPKPREANKYFRSREILPDFCCCCCRCEVNLKTTLRLPASRVAMIGPIKMPEMEATMESGTKWRPAIKVRPRKAMMLAMQIFLKSVNCTQFNAKQWSYLSYLRFSSNGSPINDVMDLGHPFLGAVKSVTEYNRCGRGFQDGVKGRRRLWTAPMFLNKWVVHKWRHERVKQCSSTTET